MPWTPADASDHSKAITTDKQRRAWAQVANSALTRCLKDGGQQSECEGAAIRQANAVAAKIQESDDDATITQMVEAALADNAAVGHPPASAPTAPGGEGSATGSTGLAEAATIKARARALLRDLDSLLADKQLSQDLTDQLGGMRAALKRKWADLVDAPAADEPLGVATEAARLLAEASDVLRQDDSLDARRMLLYQALMRWALQQVANDLNAEPYACGAPYVRDLFDGAVVFDWAGQYYRADYTIGADDTVTLSDPVPVEVAYVAAAERKMDPNVGGGTDRDKIPAADFAGKGKSFPIVTPKDVADAAASIGRAGADNYSTDELKARIIAIAKRKGAAFVAQLPKAWQDGPAQEAEQLSLDGDLVPLAEVEGDVELVEFAALVEA